MMEWCSGNVSGVERENADVVEWWLKWQVLNCPITVLSHLFFVFFSLNRIIDFSIASVLPKLRKMWLVLLKDNSKEVNKRRRELITNVGLYGGLHVRGGQVLNLWRCISCSFTAGNKLNEEEENSWLLQVLKY